MGLTVAMGWFGGLRGRLDESRRRRALTSAMAKAVQPPARSAFGAWGSGTIIIPPTRIDHAQFIHLGRNVTVHELAWLIAGPAGPKMTPRLSIGDECVIQRFVKIVCAGEVLIGEGAMIGDHVYIADTSYRHDDPERPPFEQGLSEPRPVYIGPEAMLGFGSIVLPGVSIGERAMISAGSVVVSDVPAYGVVAGNPARVLRIHGS
jgi:acetyltransferase-like isoleucine patch superfamily enzyme